MCQSQSVEKKNRFPRGQSLLKNGVVISAAVDVGEEKSSAVLRDQTLAIQDLTAAANTTPELLSSFPSGF